MKRTFKIIALVLATTLFVGCEKEEIIPAGPTQNCDCGEIIFHQNGPVSTGIIVKNYCTGVEKALVIGYGVPNNVGEELCNPAIW